MKTFSSSPHFFFIFLLLSFATFTFSSGKVVRKLDGLKNYHELGLPNVLGPESLAFDCLGEGPYTGISDGRILKWKETQKRWVEFAITSPHRDRNLCDGSTDLKKENICGRPLGLKFDTKTCNLYVADAYFGVLMVGPNGGVAKQLAISADDGVPFKFLNGLDVDEQTGVIYFSESSTVYQRREFRMIISKGDKTGRLLKYDTSSKKVQVLLKGLAVANGVALNQDGSFLLVAESSSGKITKFWLKGPKANTSELFAQFERFPDNIKRNQNGDFWVALERDRVAPQDAVNTSLQNQALITWRKEEDLVGVKFDDEGKTVEVLDRNQGQDLDYASEVKEHNGKLWIGSVFKSYVGVVDVNESSYLRQIIPTFLEVW